VRRVAYVPSGLIVYLVITGLLYATARTKALRNADSLVFGPTETVRWLLVVVIVGFACGAVYVSITPPPSLGGAIVFGLLSTAGTLVFPSDVFVTATEVAEVRWWGSKTAIPWEDVIRIECQKGQGTVTIVSQTGVRVTHSSWNRDTEGFLMSCREKTGLLPTRT
jgi:hypothetical protein